MEYIPRLAEGRLEKLFESGKIIMVLGARQTGKTTLVKHLLKDKKTLFLNLDTDVDQRRLLAASALSPREAWQSLGRPDYLAVDEAQRLPATGQIVKGWYDAALPLKIILLGSSSLNLLDQAAESLTGRNIKYHLTPLLFTEIVVKQSWYSPAFSPEELQSNFPEQIKALLLPTLVYGSYPEAVTTAEKVQYLSNLASDYLLKDVLQLGLIRGPEVIRRLLALLAHQAGSVVSTNELAKNLSISRATVDRYLDLLEQTFVIFRLPAFSTNPRKEIAKSTKIFFYDTGIRNALLNEYNVSPLRPDIGKLWENWVVAELAKQNLQAGSPKSLYFWRSNSGSEVDLVIREGGALRAFEIKWSAGKVAAKAFSESYRIKVEVIDSSRPLMTI